MTPSGSEGIPAPGAIDWIEAPDALVDHVNRVTSLVRSVRHPEARAVGQWSLAEVAMHLSQAWVIVPSLAAEDLSDVHWLLPHLEGRGGVAHQGHVGPGRGRHDRGRHRSRA